MNKYPQQTTVTYFLRSWLRARFFLLVACSKIGRRPQPNHIVGNIMSIKSSLVHMMMMLGTPTPNSATIYTWSAAHVQSYLEAHPVSLCIGRYDNLQATLRWLSQLALEKKVNRCEDWSATQTFRCTFWCDVAIVHFELCLLVLTISPRGNHFTPIFLL